ncbi:MarR family transcriptional regulator [Streptomyces sp. Z26]|uniref:MarR family winged helix-turn-helix transcriptional regulator n=1 Tax=Streptomyces TaxID=1883 RepID=UPI000EF13C18|nr:MarR family transcriptional regulator [Streptomyces sp. Z26]RLL69910.1 MarR family transcriptional regulator [Streptomyces sp. Z26]
MPPHSNPRPPARSAPPSADPSPPRSTPGGPLRARTEAADATGASAGDLADQLLGLTRRLQHAYKRDLAPLGVTPAQSRLLRTVARSDGPPRMADVAERLGVVPRAVTTLVDALEERHLVRRVPDPASRRVVRLEVTEDGVAALKELRRARRSAAEGILAPLSPEQRTQLSALLALLGAEGAGHR